MLCAKLKLNGEEQEFNSIFSFLFIEQPQQQHSLWVILQQVLVLTKTFMSKQQHLQQVIELAKARQRYYLALVLNPVIRFLVLFI